MINELLLISVIVPVYNEEQNVSPLYKKLTEVLSRLDEKYDYEIIFVNDGSKDKSGEIIENLSLYDEKVKYIEFSRNFGKEIATTAGIHNARGDTVITIDADMQHPPELIPQFIYKWERGAEIVIGIRMNNSEKLFKKIGSLLFYKIINLIGETKIIPQATDFRLLDKKVTGAFNNFTERNRITRGLLDWLGFEKDFLYFTANKRKNGQPKYSFWKLVKLAGSAFVSHSVFPLKLAGYLGIVITFLSGMLGLFIFIEKYILGDPLHMNFSGPAILAVIILFLVGIILICLGLVALYIANIHNEVINRPMYVVRKKKI